MHKNSFSTIIIIINIFILSYINKKVIIGNYILSS
jgi:hypothetical protein